MPKISSLIISIGLTASLLGGCSTVSKVNPFDGKSASKPSKTKRANVAPSMGVNTFLWRASLETLEFMPTASVDPFGGVISKDWYANPEAPDERFKVDVYILDTNLRADALKASVFKQVRTGNGWADASTDADTSRQIENSILTRARQLYIATVDNQ